jgi:hypothetical protein
VQANTAWVDTMTVNDSADYVISMQVTLNTHWPVHPAPQQLTREGRIRVRLMAQCRGAAGEARQWAARHGAGSPQQRRPFLLLIDVAAEVHYSLNMLSCGRLVADPGWEAHRWSEIDALLARADELAAGILGVSTSPAPLRACVW